MKSHQAPCARVDEHLLELVEEGVPEPVLDAGERSLLIQHAESCPRCSASLAAYRRTIARLGSLPRAEASAGFAAALGERLRSDPRRSSSRLRFIRAAAGAAAVVLVSAAAWIGFRMAFPPPEPPAIELARVERAAPSPSPIAPAERFAAGDRERNGKAARGGELDPAASLRGERHAVDAPAAAASEGPRPEGEALVSRALKDASPGPLPPAGEAGANGLPRFQKTDAFAISREARERLDALSTGSLEPLVLRVPDAPGPRRIIEQIALRLDAAPEKLESSVAAGKAGLRSGGRRANLEGEETPESRSPDPESSPRAAARAAAQPSSRTGAQAGAQLTEQAAGQPAGQPPGPPAAIELRLQPRRAQELAIALLQSIPGAAIESARSKEAGAKTVSAGRARALAPPAAGAVSPAAEEEAARAPSTELKAAPAERLVVLRILFVPPPAPSPAAGKGPGDR